MALTVTSNGDTVPYIVRREIGTINRGVYDIEFLHQPGQPLPMPWIRPTPGWNGRLVYVFGGGCGAGYHQGVLEGAIGSHNEPFLSEGYAVATSTLNTASTDCNDRISAETLSMVKEHFIKSYGVPIHTIGSGGSGGAINQLLIAQNYPGLLNGLILSLSFPDFVTNLQSMTDCPLLERAFNESRHAWAEEQKSAVSGFATWRTCTVGWSDYRGRGRGHYWEMLEPNKNCPPLIALLGVRCDLFANEVNIFGRNALTGLAYRPIDNVGVQYGLAAFNRGQIDTDQFIALNAHIGGYDGDGHIVAQRTKADFESLRNTYERGLVLTGGGGLAEVPIIDERPYTDDEANQHDSFRSFATRARLIAANGSALNQVILRYPRVSAMDLLQVIQGTEVFYDRERELIRKMNHWLDNISADTTERTRAHKLARAKPADLADSCWATDGEQVNEPASYGGSGRCNQLYPPHGDPRIAAGGPLSDDILKCALKPVRAEDYARALSAEELGQLKAIFPEGVCDYTRPGTGQEVTRTVWQKF